MDKDFERLVRDGIMRSNQDKEFQALSLKWMQDSGKHEYSYRQKFMGVPIIQLPSDIVAIQSLIWEVRPTLIIETGIARGGSLIMSAAFLALLTLADQKKGKSVKRKVLGIDTEIRDHTHAAINMSPFNDLIYTVQASSVSMEATEFVQNHLNEKDEVLVFLDSNHTHNHVLDELLIFSRLVTRGSYIVVFDTSIEFDDPSVWKGLRPWGRGNSPHSAIIEFLSLPEGLGFQIDQMRHMALELTVCRDGFIKRTN